MSRRPVILVADDSEDIRNLFGIMLKRYYDVKFAVNSDETLAGADTDPLPDLILLDIEMPELTATRSASGSRPIRRSRTSR